MNEKVVADLKQFIVEIISQQTLDIKQDINQLNKWMGSLEVRLDKLQVRLGSLEVKVEGSFAGIAEMFEDMNTNHTITESRLRDHDQRLMRLEPQAA